MANVLATEVVLGEVGGMTWMRTPNKGGSLSWPAMCPCCGASHDPTSMVMVRMGYQSGGATASFQVPHCQACAQHCNEYGRRSAWTKDRPVEGMLPTCSAPGRTIIIRPRGFFSKGLRFLFVRKDYAESFQQVNSDKVISVR